MSSARQEGYYHVKLNGVWLIAFWDSSLNWFSWFEKGHGVRSYGVGANIGGFDSFAVESIEIKELRLPSPDEVLKIDSIGEQIAALLLNKISFTYDGEKDNIAYRAPGVVKNLTNKVSAGFNFGEDPYKQRVEKEIAVLDSLENGDLCGIKSDGSLVKIEPSIRVDIDSYVLKDIKNWSINIPVQIPATMFDLLPDILRELYRPFLLP